MKAGANIEVRDGDELSRIPALKTWFRTSRAVVMHLSNGTLQVDIHDLVSLKSKDLNDIFFLFPDKLFQGPHKNHSVPTHGRRHIHRRGEAAPHLQS